MGFLIYNTFWCNLGQKKNYYLLNILLTVLLKRKGEIKLSYKLKREFVIRTFYLFLQFNLIASYFRQLSGDIKVKNYKIKTVL